MTFDFPLLFSYFKEHIYEIIWQPFVKTNGSFPTLNTTSTWQDSLFEPLIVVSSITCRPYIVLVVLVHTPSCQLNLLDCGNHSHQVLLLHAIRWPHKSPTLPLVGLYTRMKQHLNTLFSFLPPFKLESACVVVYVVVKQ